MRAGWIGAVIFIWVGALLISSMFVGESLADNTSVTEGIQSQLSFVEVWEDEDIGTFTSVSNYREYFESIWNTVTLKNLPLFDDENSRWQIVYWLVVVPVIATVVFGLIILFVQIVQRIF